MKSTKRRRVVPLTICWLRSVEALRSPPNFRSWGCRTEHIRNGSSHYGTGTGRHQEACPGLTSAFLPA